MVASILCRRLLLPQPQRFENRRKDSHAGVGTPARHRGEYEYMTPHRLRHTQTPTRHVPAGTPLPIETPAAYRHPLPVETPTAYRPPPESGYESQVNPYVSSRKKMSKTEMFSMVLRKKVEGMNERRDRNEALIEETYHKIEADARAMYEKIEADRLKMLERKLAERADAERGEEAKDAEMQSIYEQDDDPDAQLYFARYHGIDLDATNIEHQLVSNPDQSGWSPQDVEKFKQQVLEDQEVYHDHFESPTASSNRDSTFFVNVPPRDNPASVDECRNLLSEPQFDDKPADTESTISTREHDGAIVGTFSTPVPRDGDDGIEPPLALQTQFVAAAYDDGIEPSVELQTQFEAAIFATTGDNVTSEEPHRRGIVDSVAVTTSDPTSIGVGGRDGTYLF